jgi:SAM-dependent methyltransferase
VNKTSTDNVRRVVGESARPAGPYERVAGEYEHGRPGYAPEAVAHIVHELSLGSGSSVLDLGAGTGKLTRMLAERGLQVTALDPSPEMLARLRAVVPAARVLEATAESIPLPAAAVDAVTSAQAFHWFDAKTALTEIHRVLRTGGGVALVWNQRDVSDPIQALLAELTDPPERTTPRGWKLDIASLVSESRLFGPVSSVEFRHVQPTSPDKLLDRLRSSSYVAGLPPAERLSSERRLREGILRKGPVTQIAFTTIVHLAHRA